MKEGNTETLHNCKTVILNKLQNPELNYSTELDSFVLVSFTAHWTHNICY